MIKEIKFIIKYYLQQTIKTELEKLMTGARHECMVILLIKANIG